MTYDDDSSPGRPLLKWLLWMLLALTLITGAALGARYGYQQYQSRPVEIHASEAKKARSQAVKILQAAHDNDELVIDRHLAAKTLRAKLGAHVYEASGPEEYSPRTGEVSVYTELDQYVWVGTQDSKGGQYTAHLFIMDRTSVLNMRPREVRRMRAQRRAAHPR